MSSEKLKWPLHWSPLPATCLSSLFYIVCSESAENPFRAPQILGQWPDPWRWPARPWLLPFHKPGILQNGVQDRLRLWMTSWLKASPILVLSFPSPFTIPAHVFVIAFISQHHVGSLFVCVLPQLSQCFCSSWEKVTPQILTEHVPPESPQCAGCSGHPSWSCISMKGWEGLSLWGSERWLVKSEQKPVQRRIGAREVQESAQTVWSV